MKHLNKSRYISIFKVLNQKDGKIWTHREYFRDIDDLVQFEVTTKKQYNVIETIFQGPIIAAPENQVFAAVA